MARLRLFAQAREEAGTAQAEFAGATVGEVLDAAIAQFGSHFADVVGTSRIWINGEPAEFDDSVRATDEIAVLPPVSGG